MIITLKSFKDLGRCSYGTLLDEFDTEKDIIRLNGKKVEITKIEDLFPFLWQTAGISGHSPSGSFAEFHSHTTHWHSDYDESVIRCDKEIEKLEKKIAKKPDSHLVEKWKRNIENEKKHRDNLIRIMKDCDAEMEELKMKLIEENS